VPIVPRWEWRTFARNLGEAGDRLAALTPNLVRESDELYLLSREGRNAVKVRDGLMDLKHLDRVDEQGLERWMPTMKAAFPLSAADVRLVWDALGVEVPPLGRPAYTLEELLRELLEPSAELSTASVHKLRRNHTLDECAVELTDVRAGGTRTRTIAVESQDPGRVARTVTALGLGLRPNTSYPRALRALAGAGGSRSAVIDVGTNSVKFLIGERTGDGPWRTIADRAVVTRLGEGLQGTGRLQPKPIRRTIDAVCDMAEEAGRAGAFDIAAVGTAGLRIAANSAEFVDAARSRCGVRVEVISGEEEARLGYLAARSLAGRNGGLIAVFETGGGSSQFTFGHGDRIDERFSIDVGAARFTERFALDGITSREVLASSCAAVAVDLVGLDGRPRPDTLIGIGGAFTNLAAVKHGLATYAPDVVHGTVLDRAEIDRQIALYAARTAEQRRRIVGLQPARAEVILAGACIVRTVLEKLGCMSVTVSDRGLRHGVFEERFGRGSTSATTPDTSGKSAPL
jgi:exopolyphosphatase/guanosine-5'-triphosphate,3'-diphosphate pyrophosphatase